MASSLSGSVQYADKNTNGTSSNSTFDTITVIGDADIGGDATVDGSLTAGSVTSGGTITAATLVSTGITSVGTDLTVGGDATVTGSLGVTNDINVADVLRVHDSVVTPLRNASAYIVSHNAGGTVNYIQLRNSDSTATANSGTAYGASGDNSRILNWEPNGDIILESDTGNGNVICQNAHLEVITANPNPNTLSFSGNMGIGMYNSAVASNYLQIQNSDTGTGSTQGSLVGMQNLNLLLNNLEPTGEVTIQNTGGSATLFTDGVFQGSMAWVGSVCTQTFFLTNEAQGVGDNLHVGSSTTLNLYTDFVNSPGLDLLGYAIYRDNGAGAVTYRLTENGANVTGSDVTFTTTQTVKNGTLGGNVAANDYWGYRLQSGSPAACDLTLQIYYRVL